MPAISVFEFAQKVKEYVTLNHPKWFIDKIIAVYSTRLKPITCGYKVIPLFAGAIARDEDGKFTHCRINFDDLCTIVGAHLPYIKVYLKDTVNRNILVDGVTVLHIDCSKIRYHNEREYYNHETKSTKATDKLTKLNETIMDKIKERLEVYNTDRAVKMEVQFHELLEESID